MKCKMHGDGAVGVTLVEGDPKVCLLCGRRALTVIAATVKDMHLMKCEKHGEVDFVTIGQVGDLMCKVCYEEAFATFTAKFGSPKMPPMASKHAGISMGCHTTGNPPPSLLDEVITGESLIKVVGPAVICTPCAIPEPSSFEVTGPAEVCTECTIPKSDAFVVTGPAVIGTDCSVPEPPCCKEPDDGR